MSNLRRYNNLDYSLPLIDNIFIYNFLLKNYKIHKNDLFLTHKGKEYSYGDLYRVTMNINAYINKKFNYDNINTVAIIGKNDFHNICLILSVIVSGKKVVVLNADDPCERIDSQIKQSDSDLLISLQNTENKFKQSCNQVVIEDKILKSLNFINADYHYVNQSVENSLYNGSIVMFTTGTTSASKAVVQSQYAILLNSMVLAKVHNMFNMNRKILSCLPIYYANGLEFGVISTIISSAHLYLVDSEELLVIPEITLNNRINIVNIVPPLLDILSISNNFEKYFKYINYFVTAASPLSQTTASRVYKKAQKKVIQGYGLTETINFSTLLPPTITDKEYIDLMIECDIPTVGKELFGVNVSIGQVNNEVLMRGHSLMLEYYRNSNETSKSFKENYFHSGDIGEFKIYNNQKYLVLKGRIKNIIKINGKAISLDEIDLCLKKDDIFKDVVSVSKNHKTYGEIIDIYYVSNKQVDKRYINNILNKSIDIDKVKFNLCKVDHIPRSLNGKVNRNNLIDKL